MRVRKESERGGWRDEEVVHATGKARFVRWVNNEIMAVLRLTRFPLHACYPSLGGTHTHTHTYTSP